MICQTQYPLGNVRQCYGMKKHGALFYSCSDLYNQIAGLGATHLVNDTYYYVILLIADRAKKIYEELLKLWEKQSFPIISQQQVLAKVDKLIKVFEKHRKRPNEEFKKNLPHIFDITKQSENWLCSEDKNFTGTRLNQEDEWDTRLRKWLSFQRYILQNSQEAHQNCQQTKCKISVVVIILKKTRAALIPMLQKSLPL